MKKLFAAILALGLIVAFSATASAVDVKVSGSYYVAGVYDNNAAVKDTDSYSRAYFWQRIRLQPVFKVAEGLTFTARMDAMEGAWDQEKGARSPNTKNNFDWERGYVTFNTGVGKFDVGYMAAGAFGTVFGDTTTTRPRIKLTTKYGPMTLGALYEKRTEANANTVGAKIPGTTTDDGFGLDGKVDADFDAYYLFGIYPFKGGQAGLLYGYFYNATPRPTYLYSTKAHLFVPYLKATFGPVYVEAEVDWFTGKAAAKENGAVDTDMSSLAAYLMAKTNMGPATIGAQIGYAKGQGTDTTKKENALGGGNDWNPALILMSDDLSTWSGANENATNAAKNNMLLYNLFADYKLTAKFSMGAALTYAKADQLNATAGTYGSIDKTMGTEFDVTATYKVYDNLSYMVGAGYLWTGDYFKKATADKVGNDYILMNKLTLSF